MSQITQIEMWKDTGFQEGSVEVPSVNDILPELESSTDNYTKITYDGGIRTSTADFFSGFTIPEFFTDDILGFSYIRIHYTYNSGTEMTFYGWIDDISLKSDTADNPSVHISWHIDYWRTYLGSAKFGYGMIQSRPSSLTDPPQPCSYRWRVPGEFKSLTPDVLGTNVNWLILNFVNEDSSHKVSKARTAVIPIDKNNLDKNYKVKVGNTEHTVPSLKEIVDGEMYTKLGMSASQITSAFLSPIPPFEIVSTANDTFEFKQKDESSQTEYIEQQFSDQSAVQCQYASMAHIKGQTLLQDRWIFGVTMNNGTVRRHEATFADISTSIKPFFDGISSIQSVSSTVSVPNPTVHHYNLGTLMNELFSSHVFQNGEYVSFQDVAESFESTVSLVNDRDTLVYTATVGAKQDRRYTYNNGWPDVTIAADHTILATFYTKLEYTEFSIEVTKEDSATYGYAYTKSQNFHNYKIDNLNLATTDLSEVIITDMAYSPIATLPWGITVTEAQVRHIVTATSGYIQYRFGNAQFISDWESAGLSVSIPLIPVDVVSNSWSDYVYSGQRDYDIRQRQIAANQALVGSITGFAENAISTGVMGSLGKGTTTSKEKYKLSEKDPGDTEWSTIKGSKKTTVTSTGIGGPKAGVMSAGVGVAATALEYFTTVYFNGELRKAQDMLQAKQFDNITLPGGGWDWLWHGREIGAITLVPDDYSLARFETDKTLNGIICSEPTEDCDHIRTSEGPYRISELIVTGSIPVQARAHIKGRFANGVRIKTINTQNVTEGD